MAGIRVGGYGAGGLGNVGNGSFTGGRGNYNPMTSSGGADTNVVGRKRSQDSQGNWTEDTEYGEGLESQLATRDKYNAQAEARRLAAMRGLMGGAGGGGTGGTGLGNIAYDEQAARNAAFARAKDRSGATGRAALDSLREFASSTGRLGSGWESDKAAQVLGGAAGELGQFDRDQLMLDLNRAGEISDRNLNAQLTMRGQDLQRMASLLGLFNVQGAVY